MWEGKNKISIDNHVVQTGRISRGSATLAHLARTTRTSARRRRRRCSTGRLIIVRIFLITPFPHLRTPTLSNLWVRRLLLSSSADQLISFRRQFDLI